jgi:hypothetical protein
VDEVGIIIIIFFFFFLILCGRLAYLAISSGGSKAAYIGGSHRRLN